MQQTSECLIFLRRLSAQFDIPTVISVVHLSSDMPELHEWKDGWATGQATFHKSDVHPSLLQFKEKLLVKRPSRVLIPLCGKTLDMKWLMDEGHEVVGVEGVPQAVTEFFDEQKLPFKTSDVEGLPGAKLFQTENGKIKLYQCNFFDFTKDIGGEFDAIWDRGSLIAVNPDERQRYSDILLSVLSPGGRILSEVISYNPEEKEPKGPPNHVSDEEIEQLYGKKFTIELLADEDTLENNPDLIRCGLTWLRQHIHLLILK